MTYKDWFDTHAAKHRVILDKLAHLSDAEVIAYFRFENMVEKERDFCPLYAQNKKCHDIPRLNCYLCACPHFRFNDKGIDTVEDKTRYSFCSIQSTDGECFITDTAIHQNCAGCTIPHDEKFIAKVFDRDWGNIMKKSPLVHS